MSISTSFGILCWGSPLGDRYAKVEEEFVNQPPLKKGNTVHSDIQAEVEATWNAAVQNIKTSYQLTFGGCAVNIARGLAQLNADFKVSLGGKIGNDSLGLQTLQHLKGNGIQSLLSEGTKGTGVVNCFITNNDRTLHTFMGSCGELTKEKVLKEHFNGVNHTHMQGYEIFAEGFHQRVIDFAKEVGATTSIDLASCNIVEKCREEFKKFIKDVDYVFGNLEEFYALTQTESIAEAATFFNSGQTVVITDGPNGCWVKEKGTPISTHYWAKKVPAADVIDPTGAGDLFCAGFLSKALLGFDTLSSVTIGNLLASTVIQQRGTDLPTEDWKALKDLYVCKNLVG